MIVWADPDESYRGKAHTYPFSAADATLRSAAIAPKRKAQTPAPAAPAAKKGGAGRAALPSNAAPPPPMATGPAIPHIDLD